MTFASAERMTVTPDEQHRVVGGERRDSEVFGSCIAGRDRGRRTDAGRERVEHRSVGHAFADRCQHNPGAQYHRPARSELGVHAFYESTPERDGVISFEDALNGLERVQSRVGKPIDALPLLDRRAVNLLDLTHEQLDEIHAGDDDRELVDCDMFAALEDVDADDVRTDRADPRCNESERTRTVGKPHPYDKANVVACR